MGEVESFLTESPDLSAKIAASAMLLAVLLTVRWAVLRWLRVSELPSSEMRRRWIVMARNVSVLVFLLFMVVIWAAQLRTFAISVVAVAAAIVIATKELILCISGAVLRASASSFTVGDRIEVGTVKGDVVDYSLLTTTLMEVGPAHQHTGRAIVIPNAKFMSDQVINESFTDQYVFHSVVVPLEAKEDWRAAEAALAEVARSVCAEYLAEARVHFERLEKRTGLPTPAAEPRLLVRLDKPGQVDLVARIPVPSNRRGRIEQDVLRRFLDAYRPARPAEEVAR